MGIEIYMTESDDAIVIVSPDGKKSFIVSVGHLNDGKEFEGNLVIASDNCIKNLFHHGYEQDVIILS